MTTYDAQSIHQWIQQTKQFLDRQQESMATVQTTLNHLSMLGDSLTGEGGDAIKLFYRENHGPLLLFYDTIVNQFDAFLTEYQQSFQTVDSSSQALLRESFLTGDVPSALSGFRDRMVSRVDRINDVARSVSDLVATTAVSDDHALNGIEQSTRAASRLAESLRETDSRQTSALSTLKGDIQTFRSYVTQLSDRVGAPSFSMTDYKAGSLEKEEWHQQLTTSLNARADDFLSPAQQRDLDAYNLTSGINTTLDFFQDVKKRLDTGDYILNGGRIAMLGAATIVARQFEFSYYLNDAPFRKKSSLTFAQLLRRDYRFSVKSKPSWTSETKHASRLANYINRMQHAPLPDKGLQRMAAQYVKRFGSPSDVAKSVLSMPHGRLTKTPVNEHIKAAVERSKRGVIGTAAVAVKGSGATKLAARIPYVGTALNVAANVQEFTKPENADKTVAEKSVRFATGLAVDATAIAAGAKAGAIAGSFFGPVGIIVGGAAGAAVGAALSSAVGDDIKNAAEATFNGAVKVGGDLLDKAGDGLKSIGSWFS